METEEETWVGAPRYWHKLVEIYSDKLKINPRSHLYVPLADALLKLGRTNDAIFALEDGLTIFPGSRSAKIMLAKISYEKGKYKIAEKILEEVVSLWPDAWGAVSLLCVIYDKRGKRASALSVAQKLLEYNPDSHLAQDMVSRYNDSSHSAPEPVAVDSGAIGLRLDLHHEYCEIPIFEKVKTMAKLETLLYKINQLKTIPQSSISTASSL